MRIFLALFALALLCSCSKVQTVPTSGLPQYFSSKERENIGILPIASAGSINEQQGEIVYNAIAVYCYQIIREKKLSLNLIERVDLDRILDEFKLQNGGLTDPETLVEFGKLKNLQKLILPTFVYDNFSKNHYISLKLIDLKTGLTITMAQDMMVNRGIDLSVQYIVRHSVYQLFGFGYKIPFWEGMTRRGL
jgi:hypothetical protein